MSTAPMDLSDDEQDIVDNAALAMESFERHNAPGNKQCQCHPCRSFDPNKSVVIADFAQKLSDARAALRTVGDALSSNPQLFSDSARVAIALEHTRRALGTPAPVAVPAARLRPCGQLACAGVDDDANHQCGGPKEACGAAGCQECGAPDPVAAAYAECARIAQLVADTADAAEVGWGALKVKSDIEATALRAGVKPGALDLALLAKFATGEGGARTGALMRAGYIRVEVTEAGRAALGITPVDDTSRCAVCAWPLAANAKKGCVRGNCSYRPRPDRLYAPARAERETKRGGG